MGTCKRVRTSSFMDHARHIYYPPHSNIMKPGEFTFFSCCRDQRTRVSFSDDPTRVTWQEEEPAFMHHLPSSPSFAVQAKQAAIALALYAMFAHTARLTRVPQRVLK